jgi:hypothetical protein
VRPALLWWRLQGWPGVLLLLVLLVMLMLGA